MNDPSGGVPPHLLRHVHLVCNQNFPVMPRPAMDTIFQYLQEAPRLVRDKASMTWMALIEPPRDGTVLLVWQPRNMNQFPSDGYVWLDPERSRSQSHGNFNLEVFAHQSGYKPRAENMATHARRRYRLTPSRDQPPNVPSVDPCLWIVHYFQTEPPNQIPIASVPPSDYTRQIMTERTALQSRGQLQLQHNEFMLHDRNKWPTVNAPGNTAPAYANQAMGYPNNVMAQMSRAQHPGYAHSAQAAMRQGAVGPSPAKRMRHASTSHAPGSMTAVAPHLAARDVLTVEDDASGSLDSLDVVSPRDLSTHRYVQHHEWLEEVLNSPYDTNRIVPGELGLGRKGELESLTKDFFQAHTNRRIGKDLAKPDRPEERHYREGVPVVPDDPPPRVGRLPDGQADEFRKVAAEKVDQLKKEMEELKMQHAKRLEKLRNVQKWRDADAVLHQTTLSLINGKDSEADESNTRETVQAFEDRLHKQVVPIKDVECTSKGGLEVKNPEAKDNQPTQNADGASSMATDVHENNTSGDTSPSTSSSKQNSDAHQDDQTMIPETSNPKSVADAQEPSPIKEANVDDWIMVDKDKDISEPETAPVTFNSLPQDVNMDVSLEPASATLDDANVTEELTFDGTDFDSGLDFSTFNGAENDLASYANDLSEQVTGLAEAVPQPSTAVPAAASPPQATSVQDSPIKAPGVAEVPNEGPPPEAPALSPKPTEQVE